MTETYIKAMFEDGKDATERWIVALLLVSRDPAGCIMRSRAQEWGSIGRK